MTRPPIGTTVHYRDPEGKGCRAAIVTADQGRAGIILTVLYSTGVSFGVRSSHGTNRGQWHAIGSCLTE